MSRIIVIRPSLVIFGFAVKHSLSKYFVRVGRPIFFLVQTGNLAIITLKYYQLNLIFPASLSIQEGEIRQYNVLLTSYER